MRTRLAEAIKAYLHKYDIPQKNIAEQMNLQPATVTKFLRGDNVAPLTHKKIAEWLLCPHNAGESDPEYGRR